MASQTISKICSVEDCPNPHEAKGCCDKHYRRVRKYGNPHTVQQIRTGSLQERFDQLHRKNGPTQPHMDTPCWEWGGSILKAGYGKLEYNNKGLRAHRVSFFLHYGYWPLNALHKCDYKQCVNWGHLYDGTNQDNVRDAVERKRRAIGERHPRAKLTNGQVIEIKRRILQGESDKDIALDYGVGVWVISFIRRGRTWKHVPW